MRRKYLSRRNLVIGAILLFIYLLVRLLYHLPGKVVSLKEPKEYLSAPSCHHTRLANQPNQHTQNKGANNSSQTRQRILLFLKSGRSQLGRDIVQLLESVRFKFHTQVGEIRNLPVLIDNNKGRYCLIMFEDMSTYLSLNQWNREMIDKYCLDFDVGMIMFVKPSKHDKGGQEFQALDNFPLKYRSGLKLKNYELNATSPLLRIARPGKIWEECLEKDWCVFKVDHPTYNAVSYAVDVTVPVLPDCGHDHHRAKRKARKSRGRRGVFGAFDTIDNILIKNDSNGVEKLATVVHDTGQFDNIQRVFFGQGLQFWMHNCPLKDGFAVCHKIQAQWKVLLLDALSYLSHGRLSTPFERYVQIDIDDVFVGEKGHRMNSEDLKALIKFQDELRTTIPGFTYQLGFSGKFIYAGNEEETEADRLFLKVHQHFAWFPHMWSHMQAHWFNNATELCAYMDINYRFAKRWHLNTSSQYAVAPHHAGVFPVHEQLYECWDKIWNITTTSTEEYPHLRPDHKRRGFSYRGVKVLPRQTCGLFTHTMELDKYPGGKEVLHSLINGGSLFHSFLTNQFNIFMTHLSNYGRDLLGIYTFDRGIKFVQCWTNLKLLQIPPKEMAERYFELYPEEIDPVWLNPCTDKRHREILSEKKDCSRLPDFVIVGPQKTGTTALYWFLNMHPHVQSNRPSKTTFEEVQFFSSNNYLKGIDWYMDFFPPPQNGWITFEKSATYFDQGIVAKRLSALLPKKPIVVVLIDPAKRAYSWYQHMKSHNDKTALQYSFYEIVHARRKSSPVPLISLQRRCLDPGFYADILEKWLEYLRPSEVVIVDGEMLKEDPARAMKELQVSLNFKVNLDYNNILKFDQKKGFYCQLLDSGKTKCLGKSKGRQYPDIDDQSHEFLKNYYSEANTKLIRILKSMNKSIPAWLTEAKRR